MIDERRRARRSSTSPSRSASCSRCCRSPTRPRPRCSRRSSPPRPATRSIFRPSARAARCAAARDRDPPGGRRARPGCRPTRSRSSPTRRSTSRSTSSTTRASTSSGPPAAPRRSRPPTRPASRASASAPGNAPVYVHRSADVRMAVVDMLISKTFDASVICPAEQTCVVDDAIYDDVVAELAAHGRARARRPTRSTRSPAARFDADGARASSQRPRPVVRRTSAAHGRLRGRRRRQGAARAAAVRPRRARRATRSCRRSSCRCSGSCARRRVEHAHRRLRAGHRARRPRPHLGRLRDATRTSSTRFADARSAPGASSSTRRPRSARSAASTTR